MVKNTTFESGRSWGETDLVTQKHQNMPKIGCFWPFWIVLGCFGPPSAVLGLPGPFWASQGRFGSSKGDLGLHQGCAFQVATDAFCVVWAGGAAVRVFKFSWRHFWMFELIWSFSGVSIFPSCTRTPKGLHRWDPRRGPKWETRWAKEPMGAVFMGIMPPRLQNLCTKLTKNATPYAIQRQKWATA